VNSVIAGRIWVILAAATFANLHYVTAQEKQVKVDLRLEAAEDESGWNVFRGEELIAGYLKDSNGKPILYLCMDRRDIR
jgi:hypothetical protein